MSESLFGPAEELVPDVVEPLTAYRGFELDDGFLESVSFGVQWPLDEPLHAVCEAGCDCCDDSNPHHTAPNPDCVCGIYAYKSIEAMKVYYGMSVGVIARVELWGQVMPHEHGYRAEYARVVELFTWGGSRKNTIEWIASRYEVPTSELVVDQEEVDRIREARPKPQTVKSSTINTVLKNYYMPVSKDQIYSSESIFSKLYSPQIVSRPTPNWWLPGDPTPEFQIEVSNPVAKSWMYSKFFPYDAMELGEW